MRAMCDIEADALRPTKVHCIVVKDIDTGTVYTFKEQECYDDFPEFSKQITEFIGHNFAGYDAPALNKLVGTNIKIDQITDTLIMSQMYCPERVSHSLAAWGEDLGNSKIHFNDFSKFTAEMLKYCIQDVNLNHEVYLKLLKYGAKFSYQSLRIEHDVAHYIKGMSLGGVDFDEEYCSMVYAEIKQKLDELEREIRKHHNWYAHPIRVVTPRYKADGTLSRVGLKKLGDDWKNVDGAFTLIEWREFNLSSNKQVVRLLKRSGWKPYERTKGAIKAIKEYKRGKISIKEARKRTRYGWKISEDNLNTIPKDAPEVYQHFKLWRILSSRENWIRNQALPAIRDGKIFGRCNPLGAVTHRMTHSGPNLANIPSVQFDKETGEILRGFDGKYATEFRQFFCVKDPDYVMLGTDADALELRCLAHYMGDDVFTESVNTGTKKDHTDPHSLNQKRIGLKSRDDAKTFIYAFMYGAGPAKLGTIVEKGPKVGEMLKARFLKSTPKLKELIDKVQEEAASRKVESIDGRFIHIRRKYAALNSLLQSTGAIICKYWLVEIMKEVERRSLDVSLLLAVHDEYQFKVHKDQAEELGTICEEAIIRVGELLEFKIPLKADYSIGQTWMETH